VGVKRPEHNGGVEREESISAFTVDAAIQLGHDEADGSDNVGAGIGEKERVVSFRTFSAAIASSSLVCQTARLSLHCVQKS
jgi:hypothetical protein